MDDDIEYGVRVESLCN